MYILVYTVSKNQTDAHRSGQGGQECRIWCSPLHSQLEHWERQCGKPSIHHPKMSLKNGTNHPQMVGLLLGCRHWWDIPRSMRSHYDVKLSQAPLLVVCNHPNHGKVGRLWLNMFPIYQYVLCVPLIYAVLSNHEAHLAVNCQSHPESESKIFRKRPNFMGRNSTVSLKCSLSQPFTSFAPT